MTDTKPTSTGPTLLGTIVWILIVTFPIWMTILLMYTQQNPIM